MQVKSYIFTILSVVILSVVAEGIMPDGGMKKHISLVMGVIILITVSKPVIDLTGVMSRDGFNFESSIPETEKNTLTEKFESEIADSIYDGFQSRLNSMIETQIFNNFNLACKVKTIMKNGEIEYVEVSGKENPKIRDWVEKQFGIKCVFDEVGETNEIQ